MSIANLSRNNNLPLDGDGNFVYLCRSTPTTFFHSPTTRGGRTGSPTCSAVLVSVQVGGGVYVIRHPVGVGRGSKSLRPNVGKTAPPTTNTRCQNSVGHSRRHPLRTYTHTGRPTTDGQRTRVCARAFFTPNGSEILGACGNSRPWGFGWCTLVSKTPPRVTFNAWSASACS